jgi:cholesterol transport system auxiliary component
MQASEPGSFRFAAATALGVWLTVTLTGCALTSKSEAVEPRYFSPELAPSQQPAGKATGKLVRLYRVRAGSHLKQKIVYSDSPYEVGFYEARRWVEQPDVLVARALARSLYEEHGLRRAMASSAPTLEVEVTRFDEIRGPEQRKVRLEVVVLLYDQGAALLEETMAVEKVVPEADELDEWEQFSKTAGEALREIVDRVATRVAARLP